VWRSPDTFTRVRALNEVITMSISGLFSTLGAPLVNNRWSWGAQRRTDNAVFLRVWQDLKFIDEEGRSFMLVDARSNDETHSPGYRERLGHLDLIRSGAPCFMIMCSAKDTAASPRTIDDYDDVDVFVGGQIVDTPADFRFPDKTSKHVLGFTGSGAAWIERVGRKRVADVAPAPPA
jgi:hypothetical protein